jgi:hypothetical protein
MTFSGFSRWLGAEGEVPPGSGGSAFLLVIENSRIFQRDFQFSAQERMHTGLSYETS